MEKLHNVKNLMHGFHIAYLDAFVPEGERQLVFLFLYQGMLNYTKNNP